MARSGGRPTSIAELPESTVGNDAITLRRALKAGRHQLKEQHTAGASAQVIVNRHAWTIDQLITTAAQSTMGALGHAHFAIIAVGGYGRSELHPQSDIDLLVLFGDRPTVAAQDATGQFVRLLWDIGLEIGHSVRTVEQCREQAMEDLTIITSLMETRLLLGDEGLLHSLNNAIQPVHMWPASEFLIAKRAEQSTRYRRYGDTAYNLEPHLKEGPGGLRDLHMISWISQRTLGTSTIRDLSKASLLSPAEYRSLIRARNLLWRMRNALHFSTGRREDRLLFQHQREIATAFGYRDTRTLAVEKLMKRYYRAARDIQLLSELLLQYFDEFIRPNSPAKQWKVINRRFRSREGLIEMRRTDVFARHPFALLEVFYLFQNDEDLIAIGAHTVRQIRTNLRLIGDDFRSDIRCRTLFSEILRAPTRTTRALKLMNEYGVLGAYIPAFGRIVGQMQHDLFHHYTVDTHLLFVLEKLRRLRTGDIYPDHPHAVTLMQGLYKPHRLLIAGLFHDIGKGRGGNHSELGEKDVRRFCSRHDMSDADTGLIAWLVLNHLAMSWTAQKEDISDTEVVERFSVLVKDQTHLDNLYLLTIADMMGTNPHVWNDWKSQLLLDLYLATSQTLRRGLSNPELMSEVVLIRKNEALQQPTLQAYSTDVITTFWEQLNQDYFVRHTADTIAWLTETLISAPLSELPLVTVRDRYEAGTLQYLVCASASDTLFSQITATFDRHHMNIVDARVHSIQSGLALYLIMVLPVSGDEQSLAFLNLQTRDIRRHLLEHKREPQPRSVTLPRTMKQFPIEPLVTFTTTPTDSQTIMELTAQDHPGLLYQVAEALLENKVLLTAAKVSTVGERAEDVFYLTDRDGLAINNPDIQKRIADTIAVNLSPM